MTLASFSSLSFKTGCFFERFAVAKVWKRVHDHDLSPIVYVTLRMKKKAGLVRFARTSGGGRKWRQLLEKTKTVGLRFMKGESRRSSSSSFLSAIISE